MKVSVDVINTAILETLLADDPILLVLCLSIVIFIPSALFDMQVDLTAL
jgi:hypothetical protein